MPLRSRRHPRRTLHERPLSDLEDLRAATPTLEEDFHHPCPGCQRELVIHADQAIRQVRCGSCNEEYTLDQRIGGELCLLRYNAREYAGQREFLLRLKAMKFRALTLILGVGVVGSFIAAVTFDSVFALFTGATILIGVAYHVRGGSSVRKEREARRRSQRRARQRGRIRTGEDPDAIDPDAVE